MFFDEGLFQSSKFALQLVRGDPKFGLCKFHFEQDPREHLGIQLADIVAHTCRTMLLETLGHITKKVVLKKRATRRAGRTESVIQQQLTPRVCREPGINP